MKRLLEKQTSKLVILGLFLCLLGAAESFAGSGQVNDNGNLDLNIHFRYPPIQEDISRVKEQVQRASELLCDATEKKMRIETARLSAGGANEPAGDIWYYGPGVINRSRSNGAPIHNAAKRIYLGYKSIRSDVLLHELSHLVFNLGDQYSEQRRLGTACGIGPSFEEDTMDEQNHTIMQQSGYQRCVTSSGENTNRSCFNDSNCDAGESCPLPMLSSEFNVPSNFDLLRGNSALASDTCPLPRSGDTYNIRGYVGSSSAALGFDSTDLNTAKSTSYAERAYDFIDEFGIVPAYDEGSAHAIWVFPEHTSAQNWTLHFGIDAKHLENGTDGQLNILGSVDVEFEATPSVVVSSPGEPNNNHRTLIRVNGVDVSSVGYTSPEFTITNLKNGASNTTISVVFDDFEERSNWNGGSLRGSTITTGSVQQLGVCDKTSACEKRWNTTTDRWEATSVTIKALDSDPDKAPPSDWEVLVDNVKSFYNLTWSAPAGLPQASPASSCDTPVVFDEAIKGIDQVYLVTDRSYSMNKDRTNVGDTRKRIDWAKAGARSFVDLMLGKGVEVGLVSFAGEASEDLELAVVLPNDTVLTDVHKIDDFKDSIENLNPGGYTAIGDALELARTRLAENKIAGRQQAIMLLSDGQNNRGDNEPDVVADALRDDGVIVYTVPLGNDADGEILADIASETGGEMLNAISPVKLPPLYAQLWGRMRGESPIWANVPSVAVGTSGMASHIIPVEQGAERLNVMLSNRNDEPGTWFPVCNLISPTGESFSCSDPTYTIVDDYYKLIRIDSPDAGNWELLIVGINNTPQKSYIWAHVENPLPDCWAGVDTRIANGEPVDGIKVSSSASYGAPLGRGVFYFAQVEAPNGDLIAPVLMEQNETLTGAEYNFTDFRGRGRYGITVTCIALPDSSYSPGERSDLMDVLDEGKAIGFLRQASTSFFLDVSDFPDLPPGNDCDGDGIPDSLEISQGGWNDDDNDGIANLCDTDADADDVPDQQDQCPTKKEDHDGFKDFDGCPDIDNDRDRVRDIVDNCPNKYNPDQQDRNRNGIGDVCELTNKPKTANASKFAGNATQLSSLRDNLIK